MFLFILLASLAACYQCVDSTGNASNGSHGSHDSHDSNGSNGSNVTSVTILSNSPYYSYLHEYFLETYPWTLQHRVLTAIGGPGKQFYMIAPGFYEIREESLTLIVSEAYFQTGYKDLDNRITIFCTQKMLDQIFDEIYSRMAMTTNDSIIIYQNGGMSKSVLKRPMNTVYLPKCGYISDK